MSIPGNYDALDLLVYYYKNNRLNKIKRDDTNVIFTEHNITLPKKTLTRFRKQKDNSKSKDTSSSISSSSKDLYNVDTLFLFIDAFSRDKNKKYRLYLADLKKEGCEYVSILNKKPVLDYFQGNMSSTDISSRVTNKAMPTTDVNTLPTTTTTTTTTTATTATTTASDSVSSSNHTYDHNITTTVTASGNSSSSNVLKSKPSSDRRSNVDDARPTKKPKVSITSLPVAALRKKRQAVKSIKLSTTVTSVRSRENCLLVPGQNFKPLLELYDQTNKRLAAEHERKKKESKVSIPQSRSSRYDGVDKSQYWKEQGMGHGSSSTSNGSSSTGGGGEASVAVKQASSSSKIGSSSSSSRSSGTTPVKHGERQPNGSSGGGAGCRIIIVSASPSSLLTLYNIQEFLENGRYVPSNEMKSKCSKKPEYIRISKSKGEEVVPDEYKVIDNPLKLRTRDWSRVVAVFTSGDTWQFKGWNGKKYEQPVELFSNVFGAHLCIKGEAIKPIVKTWNVKTYDIDRFQRHYDITSSQKLWEDLDIYMRSHQGK